MSYNAFLVTDPQNLKNISETNFYDWYHKRRGTPIIDLKSCEKFIKVTMGNEGIIGTGDEDEVMGNKYKYIFHDVPGFNYSLDELKQYIEIFGKILSAHANARITFFRVVSDMFDLLDQNSKFLYDLMFSDGYLLTRFREDGIITITRSKVEKPDS